MKIHYPRCMSMPKPLTREEYSKLRLKYSPSEIKDIELFKKAGKLVFMSFGSREAAGAAQIGAVAEEWNAIGIKGVSYVSPETAHEWHSWRRSLYEFAPLLFKAK